MSRKRPREVPQEKSIFSSSSSCEDDEDEEEEESSESSQPPPLKKPRKADPSSGSLPIADLLLLQQLNDAQQPAAYIMQVPAELLTVHLAHAATGKDLLALALTCKKGVALLIRPQSAPLYCPPTWRKKLSYEMLQRKCRFFEMQNKRELRAGLCYIRAAFLKDKAALHMFDGLEGSQMSLALNVHVMRNRVWHTKRTVLIGEYNVAINVWEAGFTVEARNKSNAVPVSCTFLYKAKKHVVDSNDLNKEIYVSLSNAWRNHLAEVKLPSSDQVQALRTSGRQAHEKRVLGARAKRAVSSVLRAHIQALRDELRGAREAVYEMLEGMRSISREKIRSMTEFTLYMQRVRKFEVAGTAYLDVRHRLQSAEAEMTAAVQAYTPKEKKK